MYHPGIHLVKQRISGKHNLGLSVADGPNPRTYLLVIRSPQRYRLVQERWKEWYVFEVTTWRKRIIFYLLENLPIHAYFDALLYQRTFGNPRNVFPFGNPLHTH